MASRVVQLELSQSPWAYRARALLGLSDRLLAALSDNVPDPSARRSDTFRDRIAHWRRALQLEDDPDSLASLAKDVAADCLVLLGRTRQERADREAEVAELAELVRGVLDTLKGHARTYEAEFARSATNMERIVALQDIRELKRQLSHEVEELKQSASRRQQADEKRLEHLTSRVEALEISLHQAKLEAATDSLTGILNRGAFEVAMREWIPKAQGTGRGFAVALADLDNFKAINDRHGHQVGDRVLVAAVLRLKTCLGESDQLFRYGGEEFAVLFVNPSAANARARLTDVLKGLAPAYEYQNGDTTCRVSFTFSAGVTAFEEGDTYESLVHRADEALYEAKRRGKRRVEVRATSLLRSLIG
ncbi:MAG: GGDEF domain-containing protein [Acidobacteriota bacterium]